MPMPIAPSFKIVAVNTNNTVAELLQMIQKTEKSKLANQFDYNLFFIDGSNGKKKKILKQIMIIIEMHLKF